MTTLVSPAQYRVVPARIVIASLLASIVGAGCSPPPLPPRAGGWQGDRASPLGASYVLNPLPGDDDGLLGRMLEQPPSVGQSLEEVARPNPCADKLSAPNPTPSLATFTDAEELAVGARASATLGTFGFSGDASRATHFVYKLETEKRLSRFDSTEYEACCKEKGCGYGFVSALVYGEGEYATAEETSGKAEVNVALISVGGSGSLRVLHKRKVKGWVAALIRVTDPKRAAAAPVGALGDPSAYGIKLDESTLSEQVRARYELEKVTLRGDGRAMVHGYQISENEFLRRYRARVGDGAPEPALRYNWPLGIVASSLGASLVVPGFIVRDKSPSAATALWITAGALFLAGFAVGFIGRDDQDSSEQRVPQPDLQLYVAKYNRVLLRQVVREADEKMRASQGSLETRSAVH